MITSRIARGTVAQAGLAALLVFGLAGLGMARADEGAGRPRRAQHTAFAAPPLTVHRRVPRGVVAEPIVTADGFYDNIGVFRRWNDTRLYSFWGWRLGGDNFYGDQAGDAITRGNASLGMISGYGPAMGGYGGPHFDSVGGFHNGPGPGAQEADDYATGSIGQPEYDRPQPRYPSIRQQVAMLNTGLAGTGQVSRAKSSRERWAEEYRMGATRRVPAEDAPFGSGAF